MSLVHSLPLANRYILFRHGLAGSNVIQRLICSSSQDSPEYGLTVDGKKNARDCLKRFITSELFHTHVSNIECYIISSPLLRALETAQVLQETLLQDCNLSLPLRKDTRLIERQYGKLEGEPEARWQEVYENDLEHPEHAYAQGESLTTFLSRMENFFLEKESETTNVTYLIVSHCDPIQAAQSLLSSPPQSHYSENAPLEFAQWALLTS